MFSLLAVTLSYSLLQDTVIGMSAYVLNGGLSNLMETESFQEY